MITTFQTYVIPFVNQRFSAMLKLSNEMGVPIETQYGLIDVSHIPTDVVFKASYADEWAKQLALLQEEGEGFPFIFINTNGLTKDGDVYTIREFVVATQILDEFDSEEKRLHVINPILLNFRDILTGAIADVFAVDEPFNPMTEVVYSRENNGKLPAGVDAVLFTNIKLREINSCQPTTY